MEIVYTGTRQKGTYDLIQDLDRDIQGIKDDLYEFKRDTERRLTSIEKHQAKHDTDLENLRIDVGVLKISVTDLKEGQKEILDDITEMRSEISDIRGDIQELRAEVRGIDKKIGWYLALFGIAITVIQFLIK